MPFCRKTTAEDRIRIAAMYTEQLPNGVYRYSLASIGHEFGITNNAIIYIAKKAGVKLRGGKTGPPMSKGLSKEGVVMYKELMGMNTMCAAEARRLVDEHFKIRST